ncbi:MAG: tetratricopeptide repeat protein [Nitrospira sp.]|nr:tetratricopeptide repeat protein [Nitrospira sp.]
MKNRLYWKIIALTTVLVLISGFLSWADFRLGEDAYLAQDYETAMREWAPLASQGNAEAQNMVGFMYRWGQGVVQDFETARYWYRLAADQGHQSAQNNLGLLYRYGLGVPKNYAKAFRWFLRAAEQGNAAGQNHVGLMFYKGEGVKQDYVQAYKWAFLAAEQGMDPALEAVSMLEQEMTHAQIAEAEALARAWRPKGPETVL